MALSITDEKIASRLCDIGTVQVKAAYEFYQMDEQMYHFVLLPKNVICLGGLGAPETVKIVFDRSFGGSADYFHHSIMFNLSPKELWLEIKNMSHSNSSYIILKEVMNNKYNTLYEIAFS